MKRFLFLLACLALTGDLRAQTRPLPTIPPAPSPTPAIQTGGETAAKVAADVWLALVDDGRYEPGYVATGSIFQKLVTKEQWVKMVTAGRGPMGKMRTRVVKDTKFTTTLPGAPDGQYVVVHYDTSFEKKAAAVETVTTLLDGDGQWKVCGYFIR